MTASDLKAGTPYFYKVVSGKVSSDIYSFTTEKENAESFTFTHISDSQSKTEDGYDVLQDALGTVLKTYSPEFLLHTGDLVDTSYFEDEWRWLINKSQDAFASLPLFPAVGNHDQTPKYDAFAFREHTTVPNVCTDPSVTPGTVYSFDYGNAHFIVLNSQCTEGLEAQRKWAEKDLASTDKKFIIASMHRGLYGAVGIADDVTKAFRDLFDQYQVDLVLFGHDHSYIKTKALTANKEAENGTIYLQAGGCSEKQDVCAETLPEYADIIATPGAPVYNIITVTDKEIIIKTITVDTEKDTTSSLEDNSSVLRSDKSSTVDFTITAKDRTKKTK